MTQSFRPGPAQETLEQPPKRGPGRPKGSTNKRGPGRPKSSLKSEIEATLTLFNMPVQMFMPGDALEIVEIDLLATALDEQAKANPRFRKMLESALAISGGTNLIAVVAMIGARRAARHGMLPGMFDQQLRGLMVMSTGKKPESVMPPFTPFPSAQPQESTE